METASCSARSSSTWRASSISVFFTSMSRFCWASSSAFSSSSALDAWRAFCRFSSSAERSRSCSVSSCDCLSSTSVLVFTAMVLTLVAIISAIWLRKSFWICVNGWKEASSITPRTCPSKSTGNTMTCAGGASPSPEAIFRYPGGTFSTRIVRRSLAAVPISVSPGRKEVGIDPIE